MFAGFDYHVFLFVLILLCDRCVALNKGETCVFQDGSEGNCTLMRECPIALRLIKTGVFPVICGLEGTTSIVCCKDDEDVTKANDTSAINSVSSRTPGDISKQKCKEYAEYAYEKITSPTLLLNPHITKRLACDIPRNRLVLGNSLAAKQEFPHMALIGIKNGDEINWNCGGSLISENFVLTAAHCLGPDLLVRVGSTNKLNPTDTMQERTVSEIIPYPEFDASRSIHHDIGLLRLSKNVTFNTSTRPACLHTEKVISYVAAIVSGWEGPPFATNLINDLLATVLEFLTADSCNYSIFGSAIPSDPGNELLKYVIIDNLMICAGIVNASRSVCKVFYNGSPLQVYHTETEGVKCMYDIIGVSSIANQCMITESNSLDVFTRVSAYIKWIEDVVWPN